MQRIVLASGRSLPVLFGVTVLVGAALLFIVEPMIARRLLSRFGGSPAVWNTSLVFFQATVLAGYAYAHLATSRLGLRRQTMLHAALLAATLWLLWGDACGMRTPAPAAPVSHPVRELLGQLATTWGLPLFVLAATAPLLQRWLVSLGHPAGRDPYFLYGVSNLGSLLGLLAYPLLIEPRLRQSDQANLWTAGYGVLALLTLACAAAVAKSPPIGKTAPNDDAGQPGGRRPALSLRLRWFGLAFVPSSLLLGVTTFLTTDLAPMPLLWALPLFLYLLSFVLVFARRPPLPHALMVRVLPAAVMVLVPLLVAGLVQPFWIPVHLATFFVIAMVCHGALARLRPPPDQLTGYYLAIAGGGVLGGLVNALLAPIVFDRVVEYPLSVFLACLCVPEAGRGRADGDGEDDPGDRPPWREGALPLVIGLLVAALVRDVAGVAEWALGPLAVTLACGLSVLLVVQARRRPLRFALGVGAVLLAGGLSDGIEGRVLQRKRTFFGVLRVTEVVEPAGRLHRLFHGSTLHGQQRLAPGWRGEPLAYYHRSGPIGQVFAALQARPATAPLRVAVVGLGAGSLAAYARPGELWTFYELDPAVVRIARDAKAFTFLHDSRARSTAVEVGDGRFRLRAAVDRAADLIVLDAFSSDAIPTHLLTREALWIYRAKLAPRGLIAVHLSNRTFDLGPVVGELARDAGLVARVREDRTLTLQERQEGKSTSIWAVLSARSSDLVAIALDPRWRPPRRIAGDRVWTDDYCNVLGHLQLLRRLGNRSLAPRAEERLPSNAVVEGRRTGTPRSIRAGGNSQQQPWPLRGRD